MFSHLLERLDGMSSVKCCVCGLGPGEEVLDVSENFVSYSELFASSKVCRACSTLFKDKRARASNWLLVNGEFKFLDKEGAVDVLKNLPEDSLVYIRSSGKKYGFLKCMRFRSTKSMAAVCGEDEGLIIVPRGRLAEVLSVAESAYKLLKRKSALLNGCSVGEWVYEDVCRAVEELRGDPLWQVVVRVL